MVPPNSMLGTWRHPLIDGGGEVALTLFGWFAKVESSWRTKIPVGAKRF